MKPDCYDEAAFLAAGILMIFSLGFAIGYSFCRRTLQQIAEVVDPTFAAKTFGYLPPAPHPGQSSGPTKGGKL